eukprot:maker-scaffold_12-snap-gene-12.10-mRNA-1 protein AED:0.00 eAED:0.00 QI:232/1/1/1/1/1/2/566/287
MKQLSSKKVFGGIVEQFSHKSSSTSTPMKFSIFFPPVSADALPAALMFLSGLTCTDQNFVTKAGAFKYAAEEGIALILPDTSPRSTTEVSVPDEERYDFGQGAGFYINATKELYKPYYNMFSYVTEEIPNLLATDPLVKDRINITKLSVFGHSMGGHGALICALKCPDRFISVSAFAPISNPSESPWGKYAFNQYFNDPKEGEDYDATKLISNYAGKKIEILVDQGTDDEFYIKKQLLPENLQAACEQSDLVDLNLRFQEGYDHSYFFIQSFVEDHIKFHSKQLNAA